MKCLVLLSVMVGAAFAKDLDFYKTANDLLDMKAVVENPVQLQEYVDCFLDRKPCSEVPASYLKIIPESIIKGCHKCNPDQKHLANIFMKGLKEKLPHEYDNFLKKFDPERIFIETFLKNVDGF